MKIYQQDIPGKQAKENIKAGVENYLAKLTESQRQQLLGIAGNKVYTNGESWQKHLRGWQGLSKQESRLKGIQRQFPDNKKTDEELMAKNLASPTDSFIASIAKKYRNMINENLQPHFLT